MIRYGLGFCEGPSNCDSHGSSFACLGFSDKARHSINFTKHICAGTDWPVMTSRKVIDVYGSFIPVSPVDITEHKLMLNHKLNDKSV